MAMGDVVRMAKNRALSIREGEILDRLALKLRDAGVSWSKAARLAGKSDNLGSQWSGRRAFPTEAALYAISKGLGVSMGWLLTGSEPGAETTAVTETEREALALLRDLPPELQRALLAQGQALRDSMAKK
jgi:transcriptional regulator with XRE-family HTH domain